MRLSSMRITPTVASATATKFSAVGLLATRMPSRDAAGMSILSVPMKGTMTRRSRGGDGLQMGGQHDVGVAAGLRQLGFRIGPAPGHVQRPTDHDLVAGGAKRLQLLGGAAGSGGEDLNGMPSFATASCR